MTHRGNDIGLSLLELVAVMAIFSLVAVMSLQLLTSAMSARTRLATAEADVPAVTAMMAVLRRDLEQMQPVSAAFADGAPSVPGGFNVSTGGDVVSLVTGSDIGGAWRVDWQLEPDGRLTRRARALGDAGNATAVVMARDIQSWDLRIVAGGGGGWAKVNAVPQSEFPAPPRGVRVDLLHQELGGLRLVAVR